MKFWRKFGFMKKLKSWQKFGFLKFFFEILTKVWFSDRNLDFSQKFVFVTKIGILTKIWISGKNLNVWRKFGFWQKNWFFGDFGNIWTLPFIFGASDPQEYIVLFCISSSPCWTLLTTPNWPGPGSSRPNLELDWFWFFNSSKFSIIEFIVFSKYSPFAETSAPIATAPPWRTDAIGSVQFSFWKYIL